MLSFILATVMLLFQYSNRTPNNPAPGPYAEQAAQNGFHWGFFLLVAAGVVVVLFLIGKYLTGFRNPFKSKQD